MCSFENSVRWFEEALTWKISNGKVAEFWKDNRLDEAPFCLSLPRLFSLSEQKDISNFEIGQWVEGVWS